MTGFRTSLRSPLSVIAAVLLTATTSWAADGSLSQSIDRLIAARADAPSAGPSDDAEFLRRATLDFTGKVPDAAEVRAFLAGTAGDKRETLILRLLGSDAFATHWTDRLSVMFLERRDLGKISTGDWEEYLERVLKTAPRWDAMTRDMIAAKGAGESRAAMKFLGKGDHHRLTEDIARLFLGTDLKCAKCHDHPSVDEWKQSHYWGLFAYLNQTKLATNTDDKKVYFVEELATETMEFESVFSSKKESTGPRLPDREEVEIPQFEKGQEFEKPAADGLPAVPKFRPRERLAEDLTAADNTSFARNSVNRIWFLLMGRGLSHPLDELHSENPASHPQLLDLMAKEFADHEFDLKWLLREIASSQSYQRSSRFPGGVDEIEPSSYRRAVPKGLTPEQLLRAILLATENMVEVKAFEAAPDAEKFNRRAYFSGTNPLLPQTYSDIRAVFVETFGAPAGEAETDFAPGLNKSLFLMNDRLILHWLEPREGNLTWRLQQLGEPATIAEELYLSVLSRFPENAERAEVADYLKTHHDRRGAALGDLAWALLTSTEFRLNH